MRSKFSIYGHPFHPVLVTVPIGLFVWALFADVVYLATDKNTMWYDISLYSGGAAVVTALVAALPGFGDYLTLALKSRVAAMATTHMLLNLVVVALYAVAFLIAMDNGALSGTNLAIVIALHAAGAGLLSLSGVLGGEMVYRHHLAIIPDNAEVEREEMARHEGIGQPAHRPR